jgi:hypothetical protein
MFIVIVIAAVLAGAMPQAPAQAHASNPTVDAVRALLTAQRWDEIDAQIQKVHADDPAWPRLASVVYEAGIARNDLSWVVERLSHVAATTTNSSIKAATLIIVARAYRRLNDREAATRALESAKAAVPGTPYAEEATGLIYEIEHLSVGMPAPAFVAKARKGSTVNLAQLRGKPVVLVFWGTT